MGTTLTGAFISQTYDSLIKVTDNDNLTSTAKRLTDGLGNDSPLFLSTDKLGVGITPTTTFQVSGNSQLGGNLTVTGNLIVQGTTTTVDTDTLSVKDPLIIVGSDNTSSDAVDLGFYGVYDTSGSLDLFAGLFRDASDGKFHLFKDVQVEPTTTVNKSATGYTVATLVGNLEGTLTGTIASTTVATTQSASDNSTKVATTAYVDNQVTIQDLDFAGDSNTGSVDLDSQTFTIAGTSSEIETSASGQTLTVGLPSTVAITTEIGSPIFSTGEGVNNKIFFLGNYGNWRINISDSANQLVIHSESLAADQFTVKGGGTIQLNNYGSGSKTGTVAKNLAVDSSGNIIETDGNIVDGSGTANDVVMWSDSNTLTDAPIAISGNDATFAGDITATSKKFISTSSSSGDYVRLYAGSGTAQWDIYGSGENLRLSENSSGGGIFQVDSGASFAGDVGLTGSGDKIISAISSDDDATLFLSGAGSGKDTHIVYGGDRDLFISKSSSATATSEGTPVLTLGSNSNATFAGSITIPEYIIHSGDTDTFFGFVTDNEYKVTVGNSTKIFADANSAYLYHQGSVKLNTTSGGVLVTGDINLTGTAIYKNSGTLEIKSEIINIKGITTNENIAGFNENGSVDLYHDNSKKFETTSSGVSVSGNVLISNDGDATQLQIKRASASQDNGLQLQDQNGNKQAIFNLEGTTTNDLQIASTQKIKFFTSSDCANPPTSERMVIDGAGDVTIDNSGSGDRTLTISTTTGGDPIIVMNSDASNRSGLIRYQDNGTNIGRIEYVHNGDKLQFQAGSATGQILELTNSGATFTDDVTIDNSSPEFFLTPDSAKYSWMIAAQENVDQHFEITPSTTVGGSTFNAPALKINGADNAATFAGNVLLNGGTLFTDAITAYSGSSISVNAGSSHFAVTVNGSEKMRITSSAEGHIELSGTAPLIKATASNGGSGLRINVAAQSSGNIFRVQEDGTTLFQIDDGGATTINGSLSITADGSNAATFTESSAGILTIATVDDFIVDAEGDIALDANGGDIRLKDGGTQWGALYTGGGGTHFYIESIQQDKDIIFVGNDGGSTITALTLDMSNGGSATFRDDIDMGGSLNMTGSSKVLRLNSGGFIDFDSTNLQFNTQRNPNTGAFNDTNKSHAHIGLQGPDGGSQINFGTAAANNTVATTRMVIDGNGDILFGTSTKANDFTYLELATNNRRILNIGSSTVSQQTLVNFRNPNGVVGELQTDGSTTSFVTSSDYRLKENVVEMTDALDRVSKLKPSRFNFIANPDKTYDGFLAHEVQDIVPEAISGEKDEIDEDGNEKYQGIDQSKLVPLLVGAIQELKAEIEILKNK